MEAVTLVVPYYRNPRMLERQMQEWREYPDAIKVLVVDDGSPEPAQEVLVDVDRERVSLYRIKVDIPWNRHGARNLASQVAETERLIHVDIDHILPGASAHELVKRNPDASRWYKFARYRVGKADATRRKDVLPNDCEFGKIKPHVDSFLCTKKVYWKAGGYNEDYCGHLGGGNEFAKRMARVAKEDLLEDPICLHVYTRTAVPDASDLHLSRDLSVWEKHKQRLKRSGGAGPMPTSWCRFPWERVF